MHLLASFGLFASGESARLLDVGNPGDAFGLWIQMLAVLAATALAVTATIQNYSGRASASAIRTG